ncbi:Uncharacterized protein ALO80_04605, partial [Pseudomonas caricapapayae]
RGSPQRAIHGPVRLAWRPARLPPDQRQDSAVTYVALCVVCAIAVEKRFRAVWLKARMTIVPMLRVGMQFVTLCVTQRFCGVRGGRVRLRSAFRPSASDFDGAKVTK